MRSILFLLSWLFFHGSDALVVQGAAKGVAAATSIYYMEELAVGGTVISLQSVSEVAQLSAWKSVKRVTTSAGSLVTFNAYSSYTLKLQVTSWSIDDCSIMLRVYGGSDTNATVIGTLSCETSLTINTWIYKNYSSITIQLFNPSNSTAYDFHLQLANYQEAPEPEDPDVDLHLQSIESWEQKTSSRLSGWAIFGIVFACILVVLLLIVCCVSLCRKRRYYPESAPLIHDPVYRSPAVVVAPRPLVVAPRPVIAPVRKPVVVVKTGGRRGRR
ncbi:uncharacterized protein [Watersipora subatra]|uniref:uncharacterized protein n=1 Tax=Watersipora subatra TaxID=2589382 RepID=UPI00355C3AB5